MAWLKNLGIALGGTAAGAAATNALEQERARRLLENSDFTRKYEESLVGLTPEQLEQVARLSASRLEEWVLSPKPIRDVKLSQWSKEKPLHQQVDDQLNVLAEKIHELRETSPALRAARERIEARKRQDGVPQKKSLGERLIRWIGK